MSYQNNEKLANGLSALSIVKSEELMEIAGDSDQAHKLQNKINDSVDKAEEVQRTLDGIETHEVTPELVKVIDEDLLEFGLVDDSLIEGTESLGVHIKPSQYLESRIQGCEGFIEGITSTFSNIFKNTIANFDDARALFNSSVDNSISAMNALHEDVKVMEEPKGISDINIDVGVRLFNLFRVNGEITPNFPKAFDRLGNTINALTSIYYKESQDNLNNLYKLFGRMDKCKDEAAVIEYLASIPKSVNNNTFKECREAYPERTSDEYKTTKSKNVLGDRFFISTVINTSKFKVSEENIDQTRNDLREWLEYYTDFYGVSFSSRPERETSASTVIPALTKTELEDTIKAVTKLLKTWSKVYEDGEKEKMNERDFKTMIAEFDDLNTSPEVIKEVSRTFKILVAHNQSTLLDVRSKITSYLVLLVNGLIKLSYQNMEIVKLHKEVEDAEESN